MRKLKYGIGDKNEAGITILDIIKKNNLTYFCVKCVCGKVYTIRADTFPYVKSCGCDKSKYLYRKNPFEKTDNVDVQKITPGYKTYVNKTGQAGVCYDKSRKKWLVYIRCQKKRYFLGRFSNFEEACNIRKSAEEIRYNCYLNKNIENFENELKRLK